MRNRRQKKPKRFCVLAQARQRLALTHAAKINSKTRDF